MKLFLILLQKLLALPQRILSHLKLPSSSSSAESIEEIALVFGPTEDVMQLPGLCFTEETRVKAVQPSVPSLWKSTNESRSPGEQTTIHHSVMLSIPKTA